MRSPFAAVFIGSLAAIALAPEAAPAQCGSYYGGGGYSSYSRGMSAYYPPPMVPIVWLRSARVPGIVCLRTADR